MGFNINKTNVILCNADKENAIHLYHGY